jgi:hypothetical protein
MVVESPIKILKFLGAQPSHLILIFTLVTETGCAKSILINGLTVDCPNEHTFAAIQTLALAVNRLLSLVSASIALLQDLEPVNMVSDDIQLHI